jgi:RpiR family carbohydrate utilization transcriptional regulator
VVLSRLSSAQLRVAEYIRDSPIHIERFSITELASASKVSPATVTNFCRTLGFDDFKTFMLELAKATVRANFVEETPSEQTIAGRVQRSLDKATHVLEETKASLDYVEFEEAVDALRKSDRIVCFGVGGSGVIANDARFRFLRLGLSAVAYTDIHVQLWSTITLKDSDTVIAVSHSGRTLETIEALTLAKSSGSKTIALTSYRFSPLAKQADIRLISAHKETPFDDGSISARISQLGIIDALADELTTRDPAYIERAARVTSAIQARKK